MSKFNVGDTVEITSLENNHSGLSTGDSFTVDEVSDQGDGGIWYRKEKGVSRGVKESSLKLVKKKEAPSKEYKVGDKARIISTTHTKDTCGYTFDMGSIGDTIVITELRGPFKVRGHLTHKSASWAYHTSDLRLLQKSSKDIEEPMKKYKLGDVVRIVNLDGVVRGNIGDTYIIGKVEQVCGDTMYYGCEKTEVEGGCFYAKNLVKLNKEKSEKFIKSKLEEIYGIDWKHVKLKTDAYGKTKDPDRQNNYGVVVSSGGAWSKYGKIYDRGKWAVPLNEKEHNKTTEELDLTGSTGTNNNTTNNKSKPKGNYVKIQNLRRKAKTVRRRTGTRGSRVASKRRSATASIRHSRNRKSAVYS